jgi:hypothetical protein
MKYVLRPWARNETAPDLEITAARAEHLARLREVLQGALTIEEHYDIVLGLYKSLERVTLDIAIEQMTHQSMLDDQEESYATRASVNVALISLLTAIRLYLDALAPNVAACVRGTPETISEVQRLRAFQYDEFFEYRFMEALRNHVQHHALPVHSLTLDSHWDDDRKHLEHSVSYVAFKRFLVRDGDFKKTILAEAPDTVDLQEATRRYIDCLSHIHVSVRKLIDHAVRAARDEITGTIEEYRQFCGGVNSLAVFVVDGEQSVRQTPVWLGWDDVRLNLRKRNRRTIASQGHVASRKRK